MNISYAFFVGQVQDQVTTSPGSTVIIKVRKGDDIDNKGKRHNFLFFKFRLFLLLPRFQKQIEVSEIKIPGCNAQKHCIDIECCYYFHILLIWQHLELSRNGFCGFI